MIYLLLFWEFLKIGALSFGGGYAMIAPMRDMVLAQGWMTDTEYLQFVGVAESTPGVLAVNLATFIGSTQGGFFGSACATLGVVLPSFCIILLLSTVLSNFRENRYMTAALGGVRPAALGMILSTGAWLLLQTLSPAIGGGETLVEWRAVLLGAVLLAAMVLYKRVKKKKLSAVGVIGLAAVGGMALYGF